MEFLEAIAAFLREHGPGIAARVLVSALIVAVTFVVAGLASRLVRRAISRTQAASLGGVVGGAARAGLLVAGLVMALDHVGLDVAALLAGAGVIGLAVGFGAQALVKDVISGFFLILDGVLRVDDLVQIGDKMGVVEAVGLRMTQIRAFDGELAYIRNGDIGTVGNRSRAWARAIVEVGLAYEQDIAKGLSVLQKIGDELAAERPDSVLEKPEAQGVLGLNASDVGVRLVIKVAADEKYPLERELRRRIKEAFDASDVEIPFPRQVVYFRPET
jgi:moderate conductance mechanosensitive channel